LAKPDVADLTNSDFIDVAEVTADQHDHPMSICTPVSSCHCCPGPGVDNVGPLALATIDFPTVAAKSADHSIDHSIEASIRIPTIGAEDEGPLSRLTSITEGHCCFPVAATGCPANDYDWKDHRIGVQTYHHPDPGNEPYDQRVKHVWNFPKMHHWLPVIPGEKDSSCSVNPCWQWK